ncbi:MAG: hypothetical protein M1815_004201 [Lichina confinis]|nr:MAG: hypothetical protein M1815_004201 [Lichina confinis]
MLPRAIRPAALRTARGTGPGLASGWMGENDDGWRRKGEGSRPDRLDGRGIVFVVVVVVVVVVNRVQRRWTMAGDVLDDRPMPNDLDQGEERALRPARPKTGDEPPRAVRGSFSGEVRTNERRGSGTIEGWDDGTGRVSRRTKWEGRPK